jgi:hypothetical protein
MLEIAVLINNALAKLIFAHMRQVQCEACSTKLAPKRHGAEATSLDQPETEKLL